MEHWKRIVQNYILRYSDQIKKATEPLKHHFGISYFIHYRIDNAGHYTGLANRPDWIEHYIDEKIFLQDPYLRDPRVYQSGICLAEQLGPQEYREAIIRHAKKFQMDVGIAFIEKKEDGVEFFGFAGNQTTDLQRLYLNQPHLLKSFARHFKNKLSKVLLQMEEEKFSLLEMKGKDFLCQDPICPILSLSARLAYLQALGIGIEKLSSRELECLQLLMENKSAQQTADHLELSRRTIESYFENIKSKLGCINKQEISELLQTP
jgi:LuxR family quorum-sensing system transcriptional regulator SolR